MQEFTAHIRESDEVEQSVADHCKGVEKRAKEYGKVFGCSQLAALAGCLHDMGKYCILFNLYIHKQTDLRRGEIDHCFAGARYLHDFADRMGNRQLKETADFIGRIILAHHGLCDWLDSNGDGYFGRRIGKNERYQEIADNIRQMIPASRLKNMLEKANEEYQQMKNKITEMSGGDLKKKAFYFGQFERLMLSVLVDADRTDTAEFMSNREIDEHYSRGIWRTFSAEMNKKCKKFARKKDQISMLRSDISDRCAEFVHHNVGICRLIVPTGGGKTLSSLRFAIEYCREHRKDKVFYIAPYRGILEQNADVIRGVVGEKYVLEHHSEAYSRIMENASQQSDSRESQNELSEYELRTDKWSTPFVATTMVQFLNTFFSGKMSSVRRMHCLGNSVIIIDEIQSLPTKCVSIFNLAMNFMAQIAGSSIVLCSATQPSLDQTVYSLDLDEQDSMTGDYTEDFKAFKRTQLVSMIRQKGYTYEEAAQFCMEKYREEGSILFVANTKKTVREIYHRLHKLAEKQVSLLHLSTGMCPEHRRDVLTKLKNLLKDEKPVICVTTQLIEAGVDISFPCVIRALAGMDNGAQAAGRCNRNGEFGRCCNVYLINLSEEKLGGLSEIDRAKTISLQMIQNGTYKDLLAVPTMTDYFRKYYEESKKNLNYPITDSGVATNLLSLLSLNEKRWSLKKRKNRASMKAQAFRTAGEQFQVIEENTIDVLVPYNQEAKELIKKLNAAEYSPYETMLLLRQAQKYMVGLYPETRDRIEENGGLFNLLCGIVALRKEFYDGELGVITEGGPTEFMIIE